MQTQTQPQAQTQTWSPTQTRTHLVWRWQSCGGRAVVAPKHSPRITLPAEKQPCSGGTGHAVMVTSCTVVATSHAVMATCHAVMVALHEAAGGTSIHAACPSHPGSPTGPGSPVPRLSWLLPHPSKHHLPQPSLPTRDSNTTTFQEEAAILLSAQPHFLPGGIFRKRPLPNLLVGRNAFPAAMSLPGVCIDQPSMQTFKYVYKVSLLYW